MIRRNASGNRSVVELLADQEVYMDHRYGYRRMTVNPEVVRSEVIPEKRWGEQRAASTRRLHVDDHLLVNVGVAHHVAELLEGDLAVLVLVGEQDGLVNDLLQLRVLQVVAHHHLEYLQLTPDAITVLSQTQSKRAWPITYSNKIVHIAINHVARPTRR